ncbi:hypothetical protein F5Y18DRAFT_358969 [Xylariaceae sp. FL1019]|nr:hypothetical protein F5Y18DRAFT_358969 [Xylariaceae sp. FL1019]
MTPGKRRSRRLIAAASETSASAGLRQVDYSEDATSSLTQNTPAKEAPGDTDANAPEGDVDHDALSFTPQVATPSVPATVDSSTRRITRSTSKDFFNGVLLATPSALLQDRLRSSTARSNLFTNTAPSRLEDARDIPSQPETQVFDLPTDQDNIDVEGEDADEDEDTPKLPHRARPTLGGLRPRRSSRIRDQVPDQHRAPSPSTVLSAVRGKTSRVQKRRKGSSKACPGILRRSARLAKPLDKFHKYADLPNELKIMIWEAAVEPRVVYINNRSSNQLQGQSFGVQNKRPMWFMTCRLSFWAAKKSYTKMFGISNTPYANGVFVPAQDVSPSNDYVIFEPCHGGCRGHFCAQTYSLGDRAVVQNLVVQIDSFHLAPGSEPGWASIARTWTSVRTLYMMKQPVVKGPDQRDKALVRVKETERDVSLRKAFDAWKKGAGQSSRIAKLEFIQVVEAELDKPMTERYLGVTNRQTGSPEDIIHG